MVKKQEDIIHYFVTRNNEPTLVGRKEERRQDAQHGFIFQGRFREVSKNKKKKKKQVEK